MLKCFSHNSCINLLTGQAKCVSVSECIHATSPPLLRNISHTCLQRRISYLKPDKFEASENSV